MFFVYSLCIVSYQLLYICTVRVIPITQKSDHHRVQII